MNGATYAVSFTLLRTTTEVGFVRVPVTDDLIIIQPDGTGRLDTTKLVERAVQLGSSTDIDWKLEDRRVEMHPIQTPPPEQ